MQIKDKYGKIWEVSNGKNTNGIGYFMFKEFDGVTYFRRPSGDELKSIKK